MIYYSVLDITPSTDEWIEGYVSSANSLVSKHGGKFLARTTSHEQLEGKVSEAAFRTIIEWPSKEDALAFMKAPWITADPDAIMTPIEGDYPNLDVKWPAHCVVGTEGNKLIPGLPDEDAYDLVIRKGVDPEKHPYGACFHDLAGTESTGAIEWLWACGIETVLVGGLATDFCMKTTALQLSKAGFRVIVNLGACRSVNPATLEADLAQMQNAGIEIIHSASELRVNA